MDPIDVVVVCPPGYAHAEALRELAETVYYGLRPLRDGNQTGFLYDWTLAEQLGYYRRKIIIGAHLLGPELKDRVPTSAIIYNTEQYGGWFTPAYREQLRTRQVWDVSPGPYVYETDRPVKYVPVGYVPEMTRIEPAQDQDIDVLFYGSMSARRAAVLDDLRGRGLNAIQLFGIYGAERDAHIARAKVVLSMHHADGGQFEHVRVSYLLANRKAVVCEGGGSPNEFSALWLSYGALASACEAAAINVDIRCAWAGFGFHLIRGMPETEILRRALGVPA